MSIFVIKKIILFLLTFLFLGFIFLISVFLYFFEDISKEKKIIIYQKPQRNSFEFQSIDTMKYSRDLAREKLKDDSFDAVIEKQVSDIAKTGATHIGIATPYDDEFLPFLKRWVDSARKHRLKVWFRGNWSGWEGWFEYSKMGREEHIQKTKKFILEHSDLFEDGDAFSSCPECENGGDGDPRQTGDVAGYRKFLIDQYLVINSSFAKINKNIRTNLFSMNGDVAKLIMDKNTTQALGGIVTIDHYVKSPEKLIFDVDLIAKNSGGGVVLGEFGAPIPDIHGDMSEEEQADWVEKVLAGLKNNKNIVGLSYWLNVGGGTEIWKEDGTVKQAVSVLEKYYELDLVYGTIYDELGDFLEGVTVKNGDRDVVSNEEGYFELKFLGELSAGELEISKDGYITQRVQLKDDFNKIEISLVRENKSLREKFIFLMRKYLN